MIADRVRETTTTTGTGTINLGGAVTGFQTFVAGIGTTNPCTYCITDGTDWEVGTGVVTHGSPDTLSRLSVLASSNSNALVSFSAGTKDVFVTMPGTTLEDFYQRFNIATRPFTPNADNEEWQTASLAAKWSVISTPGGGVLNYSKRGNVSLMAGSISPQFLLLRMHLNGGTGYVGGTDFDVTFRPALGNGFADLSIAELEISDNSTFNSGNFIQFGMRSDGNAKSWMYAYSSLAGPDVIFSRDLDPSCDATWLRIQRLGSTNGILLMGSMHGVTFRYLYDNSWSHDIDYLSIRLYVNGRDDRPTECMMGPIRFFDERFQMLDKH